MSQQGMTISTENGKNLKIGADAIFLLVVRYNKYGLGLFFWPVIMHKKDGLQFFCLW